MIPTIETIIEELLAGKIEKWQAINWLNAHAEDAVNELRDHFAAQALPGIITHAVGDQTASLVQYRSGGEIWRNDYAKIANQYADAMLVERVK